jgi:hypothetical protein
MEEDCSLRAVVLALVVGASGTGMVLHALDHPGPTPVKALFPWLLFPLIVFYMLMGRKAEAALYRRKAELAGGIEAFVSALVRSGLRTLTPGHTLTTYPPSARATLYKMRDALRIPRADFEALISKAERDL